MTAQVAATQGQIVLPPVLGEVVAITLDITSRSYDLGQLGIGGLNPLASDDALSGELFITLRSDVAAFYAFRATAGGTLLGTSADAATGGVPTKRADAPWAINANEQQRVRWNRKAHRYLYLLGSGAGIIRIVASSSVQGRAT